MRRTQTLNLTPNAHSPPHTTDAPHLEPTRGERPYSLATALLAADIVGYVTTTAGYTPDTTSLGYRQIVTGVAAILETRHIPQEPTT